MPFKQSWKKCLLTTFTLTLSLSSSIAYGQVLYGSIVGTVTDQSGAVVPGATVSAVNKQTNQAREAQADDQGSFNIQNLQPGLYDLKSEVAGFRPMQKTDVSVAAGTVARVEFKLEIGQTTESVSVSAAAISLQTDKSGTQSQIDTKPIGTLPLSGYRNYQTLINLVPGATPAALQNSATDTPGRSLSTNINGTPRNMNTTRLDGAVNVNIWLPHHNSYVASSETVESVNVSTTALDAELGSAGGAAVTVTTKSGTNDLHGSAWEYHNNQHLKARPYFMPATQNKPLDIMNIFGATVGGPIVKNKLFYFGAFEATRQRVGGSGIYDVPTAAIRAGDFSTQSQIIYDPNTGNADGTGRTPFAGNRVPTTRISEPSRRLMGLLPGPNLPGEVQNYAVTGTGLFDRTNYDYKINWNRNEKHTIWGKSGFMVADVTGVPVFGELVGPAVVQDPGTGHTFTQIHTLGQTYVFSPNLMLDQTLGFNRQTQNVIGLDYGKNWGTEVLGIPGTNGNSIEYSGMPNFTFGYTAIGQGGTWIPMWRTEQSWTNSNNVSWTKGNHDVRFGFNLIRYNLNHWQPEVANPRGNFDFNGNYTSLNAPGAQTANFYNRTAAFLLGGVNTASKSIQNVEMTGREWQFDWYIRDRWQITRKLTVNYGLKYDWYPLMTRRNSGLELLDPTTNNVYLTGRGNIPSQAGLNINTPGFAPTAGVAYRVKESTVVRAGYGMTWDPLPFSRPLRGWYPLTVPNTWAAANSYSASTNLATGIDPVVGPDMSTGVVQLPKTADMRSPWGKINRGYIQSWNFTIQQKLPASFLGSIAYVGTKSTNMLADRNINSAAPGTPTTALPYATMQINGAALDRRIATNMWDGWLSSNYHSLQATLDRQFSGGFYIKAAYTYSKAINMTDDNGWAAVSWNWEPTINRNRARAGYDRTHIMQMAYVYDLPFGKGKKYMSNGGALAYIVGNWTFSGMIYAYTGNPLTINSDAACNCPGGTQTANQVADVQYLSNAGPGEKWFSPGSFVAGPANTWGTSGRNIVTGPGRVGTDMNLARIFPIGERFKFEVRADAFNLTNTPAFANPAATGLNVNSPTFAEIRSTVALSERQFRFGGVIRF